MGLGCQGSGRSTDLHALDSNEKVYFTHGRVKKDFFTALNDLQITDDIGKEHPVIT